MSSNQNELIHNINNTTTEVSTNAMNVDRNNNIHLISNPILRHSISAWLGGLSAGFIGILAGHPFDTIKVRVQVGQPILLPHAPVFKQIIDLYRGVGPPTVASGILVSLNFFVYESIRRVLTRSQYFYHNSTSPDIINSSNGVGSNASSTSSFGVDLQAVFGAAFLSGITSSLINCPMSTVKIQQQVVSNMNMITCAKYLYSKCGNNSMKSLYRGYSCVLFGETWGRGVYFWVYERSKIELGKRRWGNMFSNAELINEKSNSNNANNTTNFNENVSVYDYLFTNDVVSEPPTVTLPIRMLSAATAGCLSWIAVYPADVIKAKLQADCQQIRFKSVSDCVRKTWAEGGLQAFWRGLGFTLIRAAPVASTILPLYEYMRDWTDSML
jgi:solute carrier family 25 carnitine/acylcarnitine transporter 20/29